MLNSALNRQNTSGDNKEESYEYDRTQEIQNIVGMIGYAAMAIRASDEVVLSHNPRFEEVTGQRNIDGTTVFMISDQSLKKNLQDLIEQIKVNPDVVVEDQLDFSGDSYKIALQAIYGTKGVSYYVVSLIPVGDES